MMTNSQLNAIRDRIEGKISFPEAKKFDGITYYADYVELLVFSKKEEIGKSDIIKYLFHTNTSSIMQTGSISARDDEFETYVDDCLSEILRRISVFGDKYPFELCKDTFSAVRLKDDINNDCVLYLQLLISSNLSVVHGFDRIEFELTKEFELISENVLRTFLPRHSEIIPIGKNSQITGSAQDKIKAVAAKLNGDVYESVDYATGNQECGVDLVAHIPFKDHSSNRMVFYCQCSCANDIRKKCGEPQSWNEFIHLQNISSQTVVFFPYHYIAENGRVRFSSHFVGNPLIFERKRIMDYLSGDNCESMNGYNLVKSLLNCYNCE